MSAATLVRQAIGDDVNATFRARRYVLRRYVRREPLQIQGIPFTVVGVLHYSSSGEDQALLIPFRAAQVRLFGAQHSTGCSSA